MKPPLHVSECGPKAGGAPILLFIHGDFSTGKLSWYRQIESLQATHRLIVVDRRGSGESPVEPAPYTFAEDAEDILDVLDSTATGRRAGVHLVGHSYGALIALEVARRAADRLSTLHLLEPPYLALLPGDSDVRALAGAVRDLLQRWADLGIEEATEAFFKALLGDERAALLKARSVWPLVVREAPRFFRQEPAEAYPPDALQGVAESLPVTIYSGGRSHPALRKVARRLAALRPGWDLVTLDEAGHDLQRTGEPFDRLLTRSLRKRSVKE